MSGTPEATVAPIMICSARTNNDGTFHGVWAALSKVTLLAIVLRIAAATILEQSLESDSLAYFTMAKGLVEQGVFADIHGQHAFYSAGYPLLLVPFFFVFGSSLAVALGVNLLLTAVSIWLVFAIARSLSGRVDAGLLAALFYGVWFPSIWNATGVAKENLSTPLLLALALCAIHLARGNRPTVLGLAAGLIWGAALITGGSSLLLCTGIAVALLILWRTGGSFMPAFNAALCFCGSAMLMLAPWLYATNEMVGRPVLTTNSAFNLYLGNNPSATGRFVSISETPVGKDWEATRLRLGEIGNADRLQREALGWIAAHRSEATVLALRKLVYFWQPNVPDAVDFAASRAVASVRLIELFQYAAILVLGFWAFFGQQVAGRDKWIAGVMVASFWLIHAAAYIIMRYRDPVIPLLIVMGSIQVSTWARRYSVPGFRRHAA